MMNRTEGMIDVGPGRVWYESAGEGPAILLLHGGPGAPSDYLVPLMALAGDCYRVVRYDQLGSRRSDKPDDPSLYTPERFAEEVEIVRTTLGLGKMHLIGQSWGSFLGLEYAITYPDNLQSLVLYSGAASTVECVAGMNSLRAQLPPETQALMSEREAAGAVDAEDYLAAVDILMKRHLCRVDPYPPHLAESIEHMALPVYQTMWGPNEFTCTGTLQSWDRTAELGQVRAKTLILCGKYDEVVPSCSETMQAGIPGSELVVFEESSHSSHFEEPERFFSVLKDFLRRTRN
jgi:proline-specific peptidase